MTKKEQRAFDDEVLSRQNAEGVLDLYLRQYQIDPDGIEQMKAALRDTVHSRHAYEGLLAENGGLRKKFMDLRDRLSEARRKITEDERYHYKPALVEVNAPLALMQVEMGGKIQLLNWLEYKEGE